MNSRENVLLFPPAEPIECGSCGGRNISTRYERQTFEYGTSGQPATLTAQVPVRACQNCGFIFTDQEAETARHDAVCLHLGVMTPREVQGVREKYGLNRAEFARITRIGEASLARWENGLVVQNAANDQLLYLLRLAENVERLRMRNTQMAASVDTEASATSPSWRFRCLTDLDRIRRDAAKFSLRAVGA